MGDFKEYSPNGKQSKIFKKPSEIHFKCATVCNFLHGYFFFPKNVTTSSVMNANIFLEVQ